jgi:Tol biopolymer transport system component
MRKVQWLLSLVVLATLVVPVGLAGAAAPVTPTAAQPGQLQGTLIFPVFDTLATRLQYDIVSVDLASGERKTVLTNSSQPSISHDGKSMAYKLWTPDQKVNGLHAAQLSDIPGTDWRFSASLGDQRPQWAPNDSFFYFHSRRESDRLDRVMVTQGTVATAILRPDMDNKDLLGKTPAVVTTGDGYAVLYQACEYSKCGIWKRMINGSTPVQITEEPSDQALSPSPDGKWVSFMSYNRDGAKDWELYVMAADGSKLKRLTNRPGTDGLPAWSSDGNWIAFVRENSPGSNNWDIMAIRPDGTGEQKLLNLGALNGQVAATTPDQCQGWLEEQIAWRGGGSASAVAPGATQPAGPKIATPVATLAETAPVTATKPTTSTMAPSQPTATKPAAAPGATKGTFSGFIVYPVFDAGRGTPEVQLFDLATSKSKPVLENASQPSLSGDGSWMAYKGWGADGKRQGLHAAALADIPGTDWGFALAPEAQRPVWAPGDLYFAFYSRQESDHLDRIMITKGAQATTIRRPDMDNKDIMGKTPAVLAGSGGDSLLYQGCEQSKCGIWRRTLAGGAPKQITEDASDQTLATSPDGKWVAFMSFEREGAEDWEIYLMAPDGSNVKRLTNRPGIDGLPFWSPDGNWVGFVRETQPGSNAWDVMAVKPDGSGEQKIFTLGSLDGKAKGATPEQATGWIEEQLAWGAQLP